MLGKSATDNANSWKTPLNIVESLGIFDLDPCAASDEPNRLAKFSYTANQNGLTSPWFGRVFCNPPYGRHSKQWLEKCRTHNDSIALVTPKSIGARWFQNVVQDTVILFLQGRLPFIDPQTGIAAAANTQWSCLIAWGEYNKLILTSCDLVGLRANIKEDAK